MKPAIKQWQQCQSAYTSLSKSYYMSVNSNPKASLKNVKSLPISKCFSFIAGVIEFVPVTC
jgi:hypothetical protein